MRQQAIEFRVSESAYEMCARPSVRLRIDLDLLAIVALLARVSGVTIHHVRQDVKGEDGLNVVVFQMATWKELGELLFDRIAPAVRTRAVLSDCVIRVWDTPSNPPSGQLHFGRSQNAAVLEALREATDPLMPGRSRDR